MSHLKVRDGALREMRDREITIVLFQPLGLTLENEYPSSYYYYYYDNYYT